MNGKARGSVALLLSFGLGAQALGGVVFASRCKVLNDLSLNGAVACEKEGGVAIKRLKKAGEGVYYVDTADCKGFVPRSCLMKDKEMSGGPVGRSAQTTRAPGGAPPPNRTAPADRSVASSKKPFLRVGPVVGASALWGRPAAGAESTRGIGYGFGVSLSVPLGRYFHVAVIPTYQILALTRDVDGSGSIADPNPASYNQKIAFFGAAALAGIKFAGGSEYDSSSEAWWFDVGFEYLMPSSAKQTDNFGNEISFTTQDRLAHLLFGPAGDFSLTSSLVASAALQGFYNLGAQLGSQLLGARLLVSLQFEI